MTKENIALHSTIQGKYESKVADMVKYIREIGENYDVIVLDPPAFAKNQKPRHNALQAYKRWNGEVLKKIKSSSILFTFSCSLVVNNSLFAHCHCGRLGK